LGKKLRKSLVVLCAATLVACASSSRTAPPNPPSEAAQPSPEAAPAEVVEVDCEDNAPWPYARERVREEHTRTLLTKKRVFGDVVCMAGRELWLDDQGRHRACTIKEPVVLHGIPIAAEAYTLFHSNGRAFQTTSTRITTLRTAFEPAIACAAGHLVLADTGELQSCTLEATTVLGGVACRGGESVVFHKDGSLWSATTDQPLEAAGVNYESGTDLRWFSTSSPSGASLSGGRLDEARILAGIPIRYDFLVHPSGALAEFRLSEEHSIGGHSFPARSLIRLRRNGRLFSAEYISERGTMVHGEQWTDTTHQRFACDGRLVSSKVEHWQSDVRPP